MASNPPGRYLCKIPTKFAASLVSNLGVLLTAWIQNATEGGTWGSTAPLGAISDVTVSTFSLSSSWSPLGLQDGWHISFLCHPSAQNSNRTWNNCWAGFIPWAVCGGMHSPAATSGAGLRPLTASWGSKSQNLSCWTCYSSLGGVIGVTATSRHTIPDTCGAKLPGRVLKMGGYSALKRQFWTAVPFH